MVGCQGEFDSRLLGQMTNAIAHRGPDDLGEWHSPESGVGLAHRRLAIIDLSPLGHQPMSRCVWRSGHRLQRRDL